MRKQSGFTIFEISAVLLILALLAGGIVVSRDLIRNAQLQAVIKEANNYTDSIKLFQTKYKAMPGDFSRASSFWTGATNGDGEGRIRGSEQFRAWQHLASAGLVEGSFTGVTGSQGANDRVPGQNVPLSQLSGGGWGLIYVSLSDTQVGYVNHNDVTTINHVLWIGGRSIDGTTNQQIPLLSGYEGLMIDQKTDDGIAATGNILSQSNSGTSYSACISANVPIQYPSTSNIVCALVFKTGL